MFRITEQSLYWQCGVCNGLNAVGELSLEKQVSLGFRLGTNLPEGRRGGGITLQDPSQS